MVIVRTLRVVLILLKENFLFLIQETARKFRVKAANNVLNIYEKMVQKLVKI